MGFLLSIWKRCTASISVYRICETRSFSVRKRVSQRFASPDAGSRMVALVLEHVESAD